jgi:hypothetical protein
MVGLQSFQGVVKQVQFLEYPSDMPSWLRSRFNSYCIEKNALDGCLGIDKDGRFQRRNAMGRYRL